MEHVGSEYVVILNDPQLREGLVRGGERSSQSGLDAKRSRVLRRRLADVLVGLAARVYPAAGALDEAVHA